MKSQLSVQEILAKVRHIEIKARRLSQQALSGSYKSAFKGKGMAFSEVREYVPGDDPRDIDWNVTARYNAPHIKVYEEERELTLMLLIDISKSLEFGSAQNSKRTLATEVAATLAFASISNNDKVGLILFSNKVELYIPPGKGKKHVLHIIRRILTHQPQNRETNPQAPLKLLNQVVKKRCTAFLISDFISPIESYSNELKLSARRHDLVAIRLCDRRDRELSPMGWTLFEHPETGMTQWVNTSSAKVRKEYTKQSDALEEQLTRQLRVTGVDFCKVYTDADLLPPLIQLFKSRS